MKVVVSIQPDSGRDFATTVAAMSKMGLRVENTMDAIGVVTGEAGEQVVKKIRTLRGVHVEQDQSVQIAPPDDAIQ